MDWSAVAIADGIIALTAVAGVVLGIQGRRRDSQQEERRVEWERDQEQKRQEWERRQLDAAAPRLAPTGASWHGAETDTLPHRLNEVPLIEVTIQNQSNNVPQDVEGVLFPARVKNPSGTQVDYLNGLYWQGKFEASLAPNESLPLRLERQTRPLQGDLCLIDGLTLFAPYEPKLGVPSTGRWFFARLTLTYRDANGRTLCVVYDAEAVKVNDGFKRVWQRVGAPVAVSKSLGELTDETGRGGFAQS